MGWGAGNLGGGSSGGLNFKIIAYETEEKLLSSSPKENTIGVITTTGINSWIFSATEPENPVEGMLWISVGISSHLGFNALKKNGIMVYPLLAKHYVGGEYVDVTAYSYQGSEWKDWILYLIKDGVEMVDFGLHTGINAYAVVMEKTRDGNNIIYNLSSEANGFGAYGMYYREIDLTNVNTIEIDAAFTANYSETCALAVLSKLPADTNRDSFDAVTVASAGITSATLKTVSMDVSSLNGVYPVGILIKLQFDVTLTVANLRCV